jgi:hypothetical protein
LSIAVPKHENHRNEILITSSEEGEKWQPILGRAETHLVSSETKPKLNNNYQLQSGPWYSDQVNHTIQNLLGISQIGEVVFW